MKKPKAPRLVTVATFTTIAIIFWMFFSLYEILTTRAPVQVDPKLLEPVNPTLDKNALDKVDDRLFFEEGEVISPIIVPQVISPTPETKAVLSPTTKP